MALIVKRKLLKDLEEKYSSKSYALGLGGKNKKELREFNENLREDVGWKGIGDKKLESILDEKYGMDYSKRKRFMSVVRKQDGYVDPKLAKRIAKIQKRQNIKDSIKSRNEFDSGAAPKTAFQAKLEKKTGKTLGGGRLTGRGGAPKSDGLTNSFNPGANAPDSSPSGGSGFNRPIGI